MGIGIHWLISHHSTQTEISQFNIIIRIKEYIARFKVSMKNSRALFLSMARI